MNIERLKRDVLCWSDDMLSSQLSAVTDQIEECWNNAEESHGRQKYYWYDEMNESERIAEVIMHEQERRSL